MDWITLRIYVTAGRLQTGLTEHYQCLVNVRESFPFLITGLQPVY
jgi:hypothetical protein